jgi:uncharacterized protein YjbJ (UPF0337 family)
VNQLIGLSFGPSDSPIFWNKIAWPLQAQRAATNSRMEVTMDWNRVEGNWKQFKGKVKEQWGKLTDDDLDQIKGRREQLEGKIQQRYGYAKDQVRRDIDDWINAQP